MNPWALDRGPPSLSASKPPARAAPMSGGGGADGGAPPGGGGAIGEDRGDNAAVWLFTREQLESDSPSARDGMSVEEQRAVINDTVQRMQECAVALKMQGSPTYVALLLFRRFFAVESLRAANVQAVAAASLFLSGKVCEWLRSAKDVVYWSVHTFTRGSEDFPDGEEVTEEHDRFFEEKEKLLLAERALLRVLDFDLHVALPHEYVQRITAEVLGHGLKAHCVRQAALNFIVDSYTSELHLLYTAKEVAAACVMAAAAYAVVDLRDDAAPPPPPPQPGRAATNAPPPPLYRRYNLDEKRLVELVSQLCVEIQRKRLAKFFPAAT